ncbi:high-potential iron-sulfur protein [Oceanisphaera arctica]|uniref:High-potential iron-sulfur protein n=1 Tax=Oceanisphaera arctica TaxID=641510 RepID=A0A2P5TR47_9GAMM|nr:high-potential iron-sulfur protein [Oceanisphaera arctica]PPL18215.1 hypothetical protein UN63_01500 [Oceanisphaera arctica]GHA12716.1 hypothetical protein GCM10007082_12170 [Oceanisphaera arctica]
MKHESDNRLSYGNHAPDPLSRRAVLRRALAIGCGVLIPFTLIGCDKKEESATGMAPTGAYPKASTSTKVQQASVHYQSQPNESGQKCSQCQNFISESKSCQLVEGEISSEGWCDLWTKKV